MLRSKRIEYLTAAVLMTPFVVIYGVLFGTGKLLLGDWPAGFLLLGIGLAGGSVIWWDLSRRGWSSVVE